MIFSLHSCLTLCAVLGRFPASPAFVRFGIPAVRRAGRLPGKAAVTSAAEPPPSPSPCPFTFPAAAFSFRANPFYGPGCAARSSRQACSSRARLELRPHSALPLAVFLYRSPSLTLISLTTEPSNAPLAPARRPSLCAGLIASAALTFINCSDMFLG